MTPEQFQFATALFRRAKNLSPARQQALLDAKCAGDAEVRSEVEKRLAAADSDSSAESSSQDVKPPQSAESRDRKRAKTDSALKDDYRIIREIHRGGQGIVYQAIEKNTKRKVAIKILLGGHHASKTARRRFKREIELVANLKHPNIVSVFHSGQSSGGRQYCVMDYVDGLSLVKYAHREGLTLEDTLKLFAKVCIAVNYAHQKGVIHRDLKPSNILVDADGEPKVLDFGLAKRLDGPEETLVSMTGQVVGTLPYMSPEQARGDTDEIDIRTDVYALGVILYQMLTGDYPYPVTGNKSDVLKNITETPPTPPIHGWKSDSGVTKRATRRIRPGQCPIDSEVETIVLKTLAKEPDRRYQNAGELARDVIHYLAGEPIEAKRDSTWYVIRKQLRRYKLPVAVAAAFVVVITVSLVVSISLWRQAEWVRVTAVVPEQNQSRDREEAVHALDALAERDKAKTAQRAEAGQPKLAEATRDTEEKQPKLAEPAVDNPNTITDSQASMPDDIDDQVMGQAIVNNMRKRIRERLETDKTSPEKIEAALTLFDELAGRTNATDAALTLIVEQVISQAVEGSEGPFKSEKANATSKTYESAMRKARRRLSKARRSAIDAYRTVLQSAKEAAMDADDLPESIKLDKAIKELDGGVRKYRMEILRRRVENTAWIRPDGSGLKYFPESRYGWFSKGKKPAVKPKGYWEVVDVSTIAAGAAPRLWAPTFSADMRAMTFNGFKDEGEVHWDMKRKGASGGRSKSKSSDDFKSKKVRQAHKTFDEALVKAKKRYRKAGTKARSAYRTALKPAKKSAMKGYDLDEARKLGKEINSLDESSYLRRTLASVIGGTAWQPEAGDWRFDFYANDTYSYNQKGRYPWKAIDENTIVAGHDSFLWVLTLDDARKRAHLRGTKGNRRYDEWMALVQD